MRPWNAPSKPITAWRPVKARANLTAFSTASVPALKNAALVGPPIGSLGEQALREGGVVLIRHDGEVGVAEVLELLLRRLHDVRMRMADVQAADAAREVDEGVPVEIGDRGASARRRRRPGR